MVKTDYKLANVCKFCCQVAQMRLPGLESNSSVFLMIPQRNATFLMEIFFRPPSQLIRVTGLSACPVLM